MADNKEENQLFRVVLTRAVAGIVMFGLLFFIPAGTVDYWQAWLYLACIFSSLLGVFRYLWKNDRPLLERRMRYREKERQQKRIQLIFLPAYISVFILPGFDRRWGWSDVPAWLAVAGLLVALAGYTIFFLVIRENSFASRVVEVVEGQQLVTTGPYSLVRHPMYAGIALFYLFTPLALGSAWSMLPGLLVIPGLVGRILNEEHVLAAGLPGYAGYARKVKYRLIPGIW